MSVWYRLKPKEYFISIGNANANYLHIKNIPIFMVWFDVLVLLALY
ncbi:uncharacterized protein MP3633_0695 [Marinomonas primoryensis]|uniref:Uncharacterized protein n=1 Tax=Marinomonas primoryensis TaxID=178399 RepID=A0A859CYA1_9GAMM|nr:uncharacterized protein MP3633_0695 [Marinomonas primoryensis]